MRKQCGYSEERQSMSIQQYRLCTAAYAMLCSLYVSHDHLSTVVGLIMFQMASDSL